MRRLFAPQRPAIPIAPLQDRLIAKKRDLKQAATQQLLTGQNARLRGGIQKETEGVTLVSTRHSAPQFPLRPYKSS
jgi:hypothetical protein